MNEIEFEKIKKELIRNTNLDRYPFDGLWFKIGFQKGKLEQKKEELDYWDIGVEHWTQEQLVMCIKGRKSQLQKEIQNEETKAIIHPEISFDEEISEEKE